MLRRERMAEYIRDRELRKTDYNQRRWSNREQAEFYRTISTFGVEYIRCVCVCVFFLSHSLSYSFSLSKCRKEQRCHWFKCFGGVYVFWGVCVCFKECVYVCVFSLSLTLSLYLNAGRRSATIGPNSALSPDWTRNMMRRWPNISEPLWQCANGSVASGCPTMKMKVSVGVLLLCFNIDWLISLFDALCVCVCVCVLCVCVRLKLFPPLLFLYIYLSLSLLSLTISHSILSIYLSLSLYSL